MGRSKRDRQKPAGSPTATSTCWRPANQKRLQAHLEMLPIRECHERFAAGAEREHREVSTAVTRRDQARPAVASKPPPPPPGNWCRQATFPVR